MIAVGLCVLAFGALLGWAVLATLAVPELLARWGVASPRRVLQAHLDFVMMGLILVAVGLAVPDLAGWLQVALTVGAVLNASLFLPLAFREAWTDSLVYRVVMVLSFTTMCVGTVGAAATAVLA